MNKLSIIMIVSGIIIASIVIGVTEQCIHQIQHKDTFLIPLELCR